MAAALIPLIAGLAPEIINLIAGLVHKQAPIVEATHGPATGPVKFGEVFASVIAALTTAANAGQIPKVLPSDDLIQVIIQAVVTSMKLSGSLEVPASGLAGPGLPPTQPVTPFSLHPGQSITILGAL